MATVLCFKASIDFEPHEHKQRKRTLCCNCATQSQSQSCNKALQVHLAWPYMPQLEAVAATKVMKWNFAYYASYSSQSQAKLSVRDSDEDWDTDSVTDSYSLSVLNPTLHSLLKHLKFQSETLESGTPSRSNNCLDYLHSLSHSSCSPVYWPHVNTKTINRGREEARTIVSEWFKIEL